jgi:hypothetical protein
MYLRKEFEKDDKEILGETRSRFAAGQQRSRADRIAQGIGRLELEPPDSEAALLRLSLVKV